MTSTDHVADETRRRMPLRTYVDYRLGRNQPWWRQSYNVLARPLTAASFAEFWRYWNPVWGYYLSYWCYKPARRALPRFAAVMVTFTASGLAHNLLATLMSHRLNPFVTVWFMLYGAVTVASEALHMDLSRFPAAARLVVNLAYLSAATRWSVHSCPSRTVEPRMTVTRERSLVLVSTGSMGSVTAFPLLEGKRRARLTGEDRGRWLVRSAHQSSQPAAEAPYA